MNTITSILTYHHGDDRRGYRQNPGELPGPWTGENAEAILREVDSDAGATGTPEALVEGEWEEVDGVLHVTTPRCPDSAGCRRCAE